MQKIPTVFERDWDGDRSRVTDAVTAGCEWVLAGEGRATRKYDGTCCRVSGGVLYRRAEVREGKPMPEGFELAADDGGKVIGWVPVGEGPHDAWHREAFAWNPNLPDGTYELVGPKVQGNPEHFEQHALVAHTDAADVGAPQSFDGLAQWFVGKDIEGIVWHHSDGRMAKIKARDFGLLRAT